jgi:DNA-directed RNA polymerase specialized sigma subunit
MQTLTISEAARRLGIGPHSVFAYLRNGRLEGNIERGEVNADSLCAYRAKITPHYDAIVERLRRDETGAHEQDILAPRERDILKRRVVDFEKLDEIGAVYGITKSRVAAIIRRLISQLENSPEKCGEIDNK